MGRRTLKASAEGVKRIKAVMKRRSLSQDFLAGSAGCSRQTIGKLLKGDPVDEDTLNAVCGELKLDVEEVAALEKSPEPEVDLDDRVNNIRNKIAPQVKQECGTMRVLDMVQEIGLGEIYTDVNILGSLTNHRYVPSLAEWNEQLFNGLGEFDRLGWSRTEERVSGLQAVTQNGKLMIWGKPGAGKTTFLKHIAISAMAGQLATNPIPIFLSLKDIAERREELLKQIQQKFTDYQVSVAEIQPLLEQGRCLLLLDGLDEVLEKDSKKIREQIQAVTDHPQYGQNQILVTCRIAAKEYLFKGFRDVEVADFNWEQIECFVGKWFTVHDAKDKKAEKFMAKLKEDEPIQELASSPLLLTLLCLIFGEINDFRRNRAELYEEGVDILLKKWDGKRGIERDQIYRQLSSKRKEDLLSLIASETFKQGNIFFKQGTAESLIERFIQNLPEAASDPEALRLDSEQVLNAIEAQHGLLVARAKGIYSFSHLTFQEYFVARKIALRPSSETLQMLANQVNDKKWREVILLTVEQLDDATELVMGIKQTIDDMVANDEKIQTYLKWLAEKVDSLDGLYTDEDIRKIRENDPFQRLQNISSTFANWRYFFLYLDQVIFLELYLEQFIFVYAQINQTLNLSCYPNPEIKNMINKLPPSLIFLKKELENLLVKLSDIEGQIISKDWWLKNGKSWINCFRLTIINHRNMGKEWIFPFGHDYYLLDKYKAANNVLIECLRRECLIDRQIREKIENELFLPQSRL